MSASGTSAAGSSPLAKPPRLREAATAVLSASEGTHRTKDLLAALLSQMPLAVAMVDRDMRYVQASERWRSDYGLESMPILGRSHYEVFPEIPERWKELHRRCLAGETLRAEEDLFERASGERIWLRWEIRPWGERDGLPEGMLMYTEDITQRKEAEEALRRSEERFRDFARASNDWLSETDAEGRYTWIWGPATGPQSTPTEAYLGKRREELAAPGTDLAAEPWKSYFAALARREPYRDLRFAARWVPEGEVVLSVSGVPFFDQEGRFAGYRNVGSDVTRQVQAERAANAANERLRAAIEDLNEAIALTDAEDRIVMTNRGFREVNAAVAEYVEPGTPYAALLRAVLEAGLFPEAGGREEAWLAERLEWRRHPRGPVEVCRQGNRWLLVNDRHLPDGGVLTYGLDITELKRTQEERLAAARSQRDALIREVHHRIKNNLQGVVGLIMQNAHEHPELAPFLRRAAAQVQLVALVHGLQGRTAVGGVMVCELVPAIARNVESLTQAEIAVDLDAAPRGMRLVEHESVAVALIVNELLFNAVKHAAAGREVRGRLRREGTAAALEIRNPGALAPGFDYAAGRGIGNGLELVRALIPAVGVRLSIGADAGEVVARLELAPPLLTA